MASVANDKGGNRRIQFVAPDGKRKTIRLGKVSKRAAEAVKFRVEQLLAAKLTGHAMETDTARWLAELEPAMIDKLAKVGLVAPRQDEGEVTLGQHLENYFAKRGDVKESTRINWSHTQRSLLAYFGADRPLSSITPGDAQDWERWLRTGDAREHRYDRAEKGDGLAHNTARKRVSNAKQFFQDAVDRDWITKNPFAGLSGAVGSNRQRDYFLTRTDSEKILAACPDAQWRLIFALSRFGGLRCPSEHLALTWDDINWETDRMLVRSPKTEHHEGKATRLVPIFAELRPYLEDALELAEKGTQYVITRYRDPKANLRTPLLRIIKRAGLEPWPKLYQNLRATRATELAGEHPAHVAAEWLGHSTLVANKHYWQVTDDDFTKAVKGDTTEAAHNAAQSAHVKGRVVSQAENMSTNETLLLPEFAAPCDPPPQTGMGDTGLEPVTSTV